MNETWNNTPADRAYGTLLGLCAGDHNGGPIRMAVRMAEEIVALQTYDIGKVAEAYLRWWQDGAFDTGPTTATVLRKLEEGVPLDRAAAQAHREAGGKSAGCGPAHRVSPIAAASFVPLERVERFAFLESAITHWEPLAGEVAVAVAMLARLLITGQEWDEARREASFGRHFKIEQALQVQEGDKLHADGFGPHVLQAAVHFLNTHNTFSDALQASIEFAGPANYCPVLVGTLGGARWGASAISDAMQEHANDILPRVDAVAKTLAEGWVK
ncbi:MAG: hypothetical protein EP343_33115 [Deltaproteobacteria bacterium]|nr:MAG: hypothetical protein EP343_33115 [Deltaproteobacteria bacterium]